MKQLGLMSVLAFSLLSGATFAQGTHGTGGGRYAARGTEVRGGRQSYVAQGQGHGGSGRIDNVRVLSREKNGGHDRRCVLEAPSGEKHWSNDRRGYITQGGGHGGSGAPAFHIDAEKHGGNGRGREVGNGQAIFGVEGVHSRGGHGTICEKTGTNGGTEVQGGRRSTDGHLA